MEVSYLIITLGIILSIGLLFFLSTRKGRISGVEKEKILTELKLLAKESHTRDAVIKLDNLFCKTLQKSTGYEGSCGEVLEKTDYLFNKALYQRIWEAHKMRNRVVHDSYDPTSKERDEIYDIFSKSIMIILNR
jgi:hypothetical protein